MKTRTEDRLSKRGQSCCTPSTVLISLDSNGNPTGGFSAAISDDGHFAAFETTVGGVVQILFAATGF